MAKPKPRAIDLFCGCGGLTLGLKQAGFDVVAGIDNDSLAIDTYKANHPEVKPWKRNIRWLTVAKVRRQLNLKKGELDLLAGCPPCQGFSTMRTLNGCKGNKDDQNRLVDEFLRFVKGLLPKAVMMENVPRLRQYHRFRKLCKQLRKLGYSLKYDVLDAADYGVPQRRKRLILLAVRNGTVEFANKVKKRKTVWRTIGRLKPAGKSGDPLHDLPENRTKKVKKLIRRIPKDGGSRKDLGKRSQLACHKKCDGFKDVYGRMAWNDVSPTITSGCTNPSKGRFLHPQENRAITLREAAMLQGFPKSYFFDAEAGKGRIGLLIGNALPPVFIKKHSKRIINKIKNGV